jgi:hypothetical protein
VAAIEPVVMSVQQPEQVRSSACGRELCAVHDPKHTGMLDLCAI